jgi:hypothetical protein
MSAAPQSYMPPAARRQRDAANKLIAQLNASPAEAAAAAATAVNDGVAPLEQQNMQPVAPVSESDLPVVDIQPVTREQNPEPVQPVVAATEVATPPAVDPKTEARYRVLKGKYDAEVPRLQNQLYETQQMLNKLVMERSNPPPQAEPPRKLTAEERFSSLGVTSKEVEEYGSDLLDMVARVAQGSVTPELRQLMSDTQEIKRSLGAAQQEVARTATDRVYQALNTWNPNWNSVNESPEFLAWLDDTDVFSGSSRKAALVGAFNSHDAARVVGIFQAFVGKTPVPASTPAPAVSRETLVAPGKPRGGVMEAPDGSSKRILSEQEIGDFYTRVRKRQVSPKEYEAKSAEIALAVAEGRVKPAHHDFHQNGR